MEKLAKRYVNSETGEVVGELPQGANLVDYKTGMRLPNKGSRMPEDWSNLALAGGSGLLAHAIVSAMLEKSEKEKRKESAWMKLLRTIAPIGAGAAATYAGYNIGKSLGKSAQAKSSTYYDADEAASSRGDSAGVQTAGAALSGSGALGSGYFGAKNAKRWYDIVAANKEIPKLEGEIKALEAGSKATSGAGAAAARMADNRMGKVIGRFGARGIDDVVGEAQDMAQIKNLGRFSSEMGTSPASVVDQINMQAKAKKLRKLRDVANQSRVWAKGKTIGGFAGSALLSLITYLMARGANKNSEEAARLRGE